TPAAVAAPAAAGSAELADLRKQLAALTGRYRDEHPDVESLRSRIARLEARLAEARQADGTATAAPTRVGPSLDGSRAPPPPRHPGGPEPREEAGRPPIPHLRHPRQRRGDAADRAGPGQPDARLRQAQRQLQGTPEQAARSADVGPAGAALEGRPLPHAGSGQP